MSLNINARAARLAQIEEAMADLEAVFADPECFHSPGSMDPRPVQDYAVSLASEFVGAYRDDLIPARLARLVEAEDAGQPKVARRHLTFVRRKVATRMSEWRAEIAANPQVAEGPDCAGSPERPAVAGGARTALVAAS
jgi:hypothetical protein